MGKKSKNRDRGFVYSTNPEFAGYGDAGEHIETKEPGDQKLQVRTDSKGRKGKTVTLVTGFIGTDADLNALAKLLKSRCGVGGSVKDGEILLQGQIVDKVSSILSDEGYPVR